VSGVLCECQNQGNKNYLNVGIGININSSPIPGTSVCLKEIAGISDTINIDAFIDKLSSNLMAYLIEADKNGLTGSLMEFIESRLEFLNEEVDIFDETLTNVLHSGKFIGINRFGHAKLQKEDGEKVEMMEGRMRRRRK